MIGIGNTGSLTARQSFGLDRLIDLSRLLRVTDPDANVVRVSVRNDAIDSDVLTLLSDDLFHTGDGTISLPVGALDRITDLVCAASEQRSTTEDQFGRVPPTDNEMVVAGCEGDPVVSRTAARFANAVRGVAGRRPMWCATPWPEGRRWAAAITHDLDVATGWPLATGARTVELLKKGMVTGAMRAIVAAGASALNNPVWTTAHACIKAAEARNVRATWFVITGDPSVRSFIAGDVTYKPESSLVRKILREVKKGGHEIGLHGSFATMDDQALMEEQRGRLASITRTGVSGVRQHFLRYRPPGTLKNMAATGFEYDSSAGFSDRNGFRLGVADVVPAWNDAESRTMGIDLAPLTWMDRTLSKYKNVEDPETILKDAIALAEVCEKAEGLWVGLWHPNMSSALGYPGHESVLPGIVSHVVDREAFVAPLGEIVEWRKARREIRVTRVGEDGRFELRVKGEIGIGKLICEDPVNGDERTCSVLGRS